ncbi:MAG: hypothetical protein CL535_16495 [Ahrensia sp.]|nr:hypothetical protein [Ahrensia sp.]
MIQRGARHDASKFDPVEMHPLQKMQEMIDEGGPAPYGTEEYKRRTAILGPMLKHHYENNSHHPEHYENGVNCMDLFDVVEMFFDWKAASERGEESAMNISHACAKYKIDEQLTGIFRNTAGRLGYAHK